MKTLVLGASPNPARYSHKAVSLLLKYEHEVVPVGIRKGDIEGLEILLGKPDISGIHTVTLYIGPAKQVDHYDYIFSLDPKRIIFNPGTENDELISTAREKGIETVQYCTLLMLSRGIY